MIKKLNWAAKAVIAFGVPAATALTSLATQWTDATADGFVSGAEWQLIGIGVVSGVWAFYKANGPKPT